VPLALEQIVHEEAADFFGASQSDKVPGLDFNAERVVWLQVDVLEKSHISRIAVRYLGKVKNASHRRSP
jgi:hypothetical protein